MQGVPLLRDLFDVVLVTPTVAAELRAGGQRPGARLLENNSWLSIRAPSRPPDRLLSEELDPGESESIALACELPNAVVLLDERRARRIAQRVYSLEVRGSLAILIAARRAGLVGPLSGLLPRIVSAGIFLSPHLMEQALREVGEA